MGYAVSLGFWLGSLVGRPEVIFSNEWSYKLDSLSRLSWRISFKSGKALYLKLACALSSLAK